MEDSLRENTASPSGGSHCAQRWGRWIVPAAVALHVVLSAYLCWTLPIWVDESYSLNTSGQGPLYAFRQALAFELQPPLYFVALSLWRCIDDSVFFARLFSLLCSAGSLIVTAAASRRWLPELHPGWIVGAIALNPFLVWASGEIRGYALLILLASLLLLLLYDGFMTEPPNNRARWLYGATALASLYAQYYMGFLLLAGAGALAAAGRWRALWLYIALMLGVGLLFSPMLFVLAEQVVDHTSTTAGVSSPLKAVWLLLHHAQEIVLPFYRTPLRLSYAGAGIFAAFALGLLAVGRRRLDTRHLALWSAGAMALLGYSAAVLVSGPELVSRRHCAGLFVLANLIPFSFISLLDGRARRLAASLWLLLLLPVTAFTLQQILEPMAKAGDAERVAHYIQERESEDQPILVFPAESALPLAHYYRGRNAIVPLPRPMDFANYDLHEGVLVSAEQIDAALAAHPGEHAGIWVVATMLPGFDVYLGVDFNSELLVDYIQRNYRTRGKRSFLEAEVILLRRRE